MITMTAAPGTQFKGQTGLTYRADDNGIIRFVRTDDVAILQAAGALPHVTPATKNLKVQPHQLLYFAGAAHQADAQGLLADVPHDEAVVLIKNGTAAEATDDDLEPAPVTAQPAVTATPEPAPPEPPAEQPAPDTEPAQ